MSAKYYFAMTLLVVFAMCHIPAVVAQDAEAEDQKLSQEQLEQLVAPIALHPDSLMSQILMASTYPLEIVQAARWVEQNPKVTGDALEDAMEKQEWDPSVKSLTAFPQVLQMMNDELEWTQQLGDAFLAQDQDVLDAVQNLRQKADKAGNLKTTEQQTVETQEIARESGKKETVYVIQPADPKVVYVPAYNPTVIYGPWAYPAYPPYYWYPPGYAASRLFWFGTGVLVGRALWGGCHWGRRNVYINVNRYNSFNRTKINNRNWRHNPRHRRAVPYKGRDVRKRYANRTRDVKSREKFRGRADRARRDLKRPAAGNRPGKKQRPTAGKRPAGGNKAARPNNKKRPAAGNKQANRKARPNNKKRPAAKKKPTNRKARPSNKKRPAAGKRPANRKARPSSGKRRAQPRQRQRSSAYRGAGSGKQARRQSSRGRSSRSGGRRRR